MSVIIRPETAQDRGAVWGVNQQAFGGDAEASLAEALRDGGFTEVSLVAEKNDAIVGHILFGRVQIDTAATMIDAVSLAPMAVVPNHQRQGVGALLVEAGLDVARRNGHKIAVVLGHPEFYSRFGFSAKLAEPLQSPFGGGEAWMAMELAPEALAGIAGKVEYPPPFLNLE